MNRAILVKSCQKNADRRRACEMTWRSSLGMIVPINFVVGGGAKAGLHDRCIHVDGGDDYGSNSLKLKAALAKILSVETTPDDFHLFICDDDTFIHPQRWLAHEPTGEFECRLYRPQTDADVKRNGGRPWANGGAGWWMSRRVCEWYVNEVTERCSWDDILATRIAQQHGIEIADRPDLYCCDRYGDSRWRVSADNNSPITCHPVEPAEMVEMWEAVKSQCQTA